LPDSGVNASLATESDEQLSGERGGGRERESRREGEGERNTERAREGVILMVKGVGRAVERMGDIEKRHG
jgi:hypothetical protein